MVRTRAPLPLRLGAVAAALTLLLAAPSASAASGWTVTLEAARPVPGIGPRATELAAVELADGNLLFVTPTSSASGGALSAVLTDVNGALLQGPTTVAETGTTSLQFSLAPRGDQGATVVWVAGSSPAIALFDGSGFSSFATTAFQGFQVYACKAAAPRGPIVLACDSTPLGPGPATRQVRLAQLAPDGSLLAPLVTLSIGPATGSSLRALTLDSQDTSWVAFQSPSPVNATREDLAFAALDAGGSLATPPTLLLPDTEALDAIALSPAPVGDGTLWVSFAETGTPSKNATVHLQSWRSGERTARAAASFESAATRTLDTASLHGKDPSGEVGAFAWLEAPGPAAPARLRVVTLDSNLSALDPVSGPLGAFSGGARFVGLLPAVLDGPFPPSLQRITIAPPLAVLPAQALTPVLLALAAVSGASTLALAGLSDRFKWALLASLWPLYAVLRRDRILVDNMRRGAILQVVTESPGIHFKDLALRTGISQGALRHHLGVLEEFGFISRSFGRRSLTIYPEGKNPIREEPFRRMRAQILREIRAAPGLTHAELARRVGVKWSTLSYHMEALRAEKQVRLWRRAQVRRYYPLDKP